MREIRLLQITAKLLQIKWQHDKEKNASCYGERQIEAEMDIRAKQDESIAEARGIAFWSEAALCRSTFFFLDSHTSGDHVREVQSHVLITGRETPTVRPTPFRNPFFSSQHRGHSVGGTSHFFFRPPLGCTTRSNAIKDWEQTLFFILLVGLWSCEHTLRLIILVALCNCEHTTPSFASSLPALWLSRIASLTDEHG